MFCAKNSLTFEDDLSKEENLSLADLDLNKLKLSEEDALALSYLTPGLSKRIQKQLLSKLAPSEARKLQRTLSSRTSEESKEPKVFRRSADRIFSTLPRKLSDFEATEKSRIPKSFLPVKPSYEFKVRASSIGAEPKLTREPQSPDSSISESLSTSYRNNDSSSKCTSDSSISRPYSKYSDSSFSRYDSNSMLDKTGTARRISRFLRPDFFDHPKEENVYLKEKKEREMETQKVLKEIRDKRKSRMSLRRERSVSREKQLEETEKPIIKTSEICDHSKNLHDYVNVKGVENSTPVLKKERISRIARPKSYPTESVEQSKASAEKESKICKLRKGFSRQNKDKTKEDKNEENKFINEEEKTHRNKLLQSIEKKLEKFRSVKDLEEIQTLQQKKNSVENAIKRLREQSLPRNLEPCTESGLIKRAVSVEDLSGSKPLQASKKSVSKILGLFKKYEEQDKRKALKKPTDNSKSKAKKDANKSVMNESEKNCRGEPSLSEASQSEKKERPRSLLLDKSKHFQTGCNGAKSDTLLNGNNKESTVKSKLPVNAHRRSLNLEPHRFYRNSEDKINSNSEESTTKENRNSLTTTDDSSVILSPSEDYVSCDSWSVCSDTHPINDLLHSPNGNESESVIDRIRRKSFYTRFNEKKRPRKTNLDLGYGRSYEYNNSSNSSRNPVMRRASYASTTFQEPAKPTSTVTYRPYTRSASLLNDYVNVPDRYQTYSSKIGRPSSSSIYSESEDIALDDLLLPTAKSRKYSFHIQPSRLIRTSVSPVNEYLLDRNLSSKVTSTNTEPV